MSARPFTAEEITQRGEDLYERSIRAKVEGNTRSKYLVIDIETGDYEIGDDYLALSDLVLAKRRAMGGGCALLVGRTKANDRLAADEARSRVGKRFHDRTADVAAVEAVAFAHVPLRRLVSGDHILIARQVGRAVATWRNVASKVGLTRAEIDRMASAFEHDDSKAARAL